MTLTKTQAILICLSPFLIIYLFGSFIGKQFNPFQWDEFGRLAYILFSVAFTVICTIYILSECKIK